jgi:hypothetical protein
MSMGEHDDCVVDLCELAMLMLLVLVGCSIKEVDPPTLWRLFVLIVMERRGLGV